MRYPRQFGSPAEFATRTHLLVFEILQAHSAFRAAAGQQTPVRYAWATAEAEEEAAVAVLSTPCLGVPGAATLFEHITWYLSATDRPCCSAALRARAADLCLLLRWARATGEPVYVFLPSVKRQSHTALAHAIGTCRDAWHRLETVPALGEVRREAEAGVRETVSLLLNTPSGSRAGAEALHAHLRWFVPELERANLGGASGLLGGLKARLMDLETLLPGERQAEAA